MAIDPSATYPGQIDVTSDPTGYPNGQAQNVQVPGDGTGTPLEKAWVNDFFGFIQALMAEQSITVSGNSEKVGASDIVDAINQKLGVAATADKKIKWLNWRVGARYIAGLTGTPDSEQIAVVSPNYIERNTVGGGPSPQAAYNALRWARDGIELYSMSSLNMYRYTATDPYDLTTLSYVANSGNIFQQIEGFHVLNNGTKAYVNNGNFSRFEEWDFGTAYDVTTLAVNDVATSYTTQDSDMKGLWVSPDGLYLYCVGQFNGNVYRYEFGTAFDITTLTFDTSFTVGIPTDPIDIALSPDGVHCAVVANQGGPNRAEVASWIFPSGLSATWPGDYSDTGNTVIPQQGFPVGLNFQSFFVTGCAYNGDGSRLCFVDDNAELFAELLIGVPYL